MQAQRADREMLSKEVSQLRKALRRRSTLAPALFSAPDVGGGCDDKGVGTDPIPTSVKGIQAVLEMPDSPEVVALRVRGNAAAWRRCRAPPPPPAHDEARALGYFRTKWACCE